MQQKNYRLENEKHNQANHTDSPLARLSGVGEHYMLNGNIVHSFKRKSLLALCMLLCLPGVASANAGVPMIFLAMPVLGLSIIPIIIIEAVFLSKKILKEHSAQGVKIAVRNANIITYALLVFWPIGFWVLDSATIQ